MRFIVELDMEALRRRISGVPPVSAGEVVAWLLAMGFVGTDEPTIWVGDEAAVNELLPDEVVGARLVPD